MFRWIPYTFVRTLLFFIGGILSAYYFPDLFPPWLPLTAVTLLTLGYFALVFSGRSARRAFNPGWIALPLVFVLGYAHLLRQTERRDHGHLLNNSEPFSCYRAIITRFPEEKARSWKLEARVIDIRTSRWKPVTGKLVLYFSKEDFVRPFRYGDVLLIEGNPRVTDGPSNPGEFDYREYLSFKNIHHQHFIRGKSVIRIGHSPPNVLTDISFRGRAWAERTLDRFIDGQREQAIASALVLGVTDGLDNELLNAYSATGAMHILAVSGLHISIIYFILLWILSPLNKVRRGRWALAFISLGILWLYAFVTGLSPSVLRAVMMFSFIALARPWARSTNIYNTLAVSAFCLILFDPFLVFSVGFQLSYLAVLGIVYIYPRILRWWEPGHRITFEIWKISAVAISAQIATLPLALLYFHQFPNYFLLSNLLVVPLSFVVLILGLAVLSVNFFSPLASAFGFCLELVIRLLNGIVFTMEGFPFSVIADVYISPSQCVLLFVFILAMLCLFEFRRFGYLVMAALAIMFFVVLQWRHYYQAVDARMLAVYKIPGHTAIDLIDRGRAFFLYDSALKSDPVTLKYHVSPNRIGAGVRYERMAVNVRDFAGCKLIVWNGNRIIQIDKPEFEVPLFEVDWVIISNNAVATPDNISGVRCRKVILDSSNSFFFASRFLDAAKLYKLDVHSVLHQGAFTITIEKKDT